MLVKLLGTLLHQSVSRLSQLDTALMVLAPATDLAELEMLTLKMERPRPCTTEKMLAHCLATQSKELALMARLMVLKTTSMTLALIIALKLQMRSSWNKIPEEKYHTGSFSINVRFMK